MKSFVLNLDLKKNLYVHMYKIAKERMEFSVSNVRHMCQKPTCDVGISIKVPKRTTIFSPFFPPPCGLFFICCIAALSFLTHD